MERNGRTVMGQPFFLEKTCGETGKSPLLLFEALCRDGPPAFAENTNAEAPFNKLYAFPAT